MLMNRRKTDIEKITRRAEENPVQMLGPDLETYLEIGLDLETDPDTEKAR